MGAFRNTGWEFTKSAKDRNIRLKSVFNRKPLYMTRIKIKTAQGEYPCAGVCFQESLSKAVEKFSHQYYRR